MLLLACVFAGRSLTCLCPRSSPQPTLGEATRLVEAGEKYLAEKAHPDPYIVPYYYGGSAYHRNPPFPKQVSQPTLQALERAERANVGHRSCYGLVLTGVPQLTSLSPPADIHSSRLWTGRVLKRPWRGAKVERGERGRLESRVSNPKRNLFLTLFRGLNCTLALQHTHTHTHFIQSAVFLRLSLSRLVKGGCSSSAIHPRRPPS